MYNNIMKADNIQTTTTEDLRAHVLLSLVLRAMALGPRRKMAELLQPQEVLQGLAPGVEARQCLLFPTLHCPQHPVCRSTDRNGAHCQT